jgi:hypothetical protein
MRAWVEDVTETLDVVPRRWFATQHVREKFGYRARRLRSRRNEHRSPGIGSPTFWLDRRSQYPQGRSTPALELGRRDGAS